MYISDVVFRRIQRLIATSLYRISPCPSLAVIVPISQSFQLQSTRPKLGLLHSNGRQSIQCWRDRLRVIFQLHLLYSIHTDLLGRMSAKVFHIPLIQVTPSFALHSIVQRTPKPSDDASKDHPSIKIYHSADEMFADPSIEIIVITTTPDTHFLFTKAAMEAGKHVLVEKPFVPTSSEAQTLIDISAKTKKFICVYQNRRWDSGKIVPPCHTLI